MKIVVFGPEKRVGALLGDRVIDLNRASAQLPARLLNFIEAGKPALDGAILAIEKHGKSNPGDGIVHSVNDVQIHAPWPERRIACVGGNYAKHLRGMWANRLGKTDITVEEVAAEAKKAGQWGFWKVPAEVAGPGGTIPFPKRVTYFDYEGEVAIIIGKRGKHPGQQNQRLRLGRHAFSRLVDSRRRRHRPCREL
jgi:2-keto-4-pentenoate hydratase/2-oxohepta-3-ene-1,7-dioic acid hydratase in catechol pathway